MLLIKTSKFGTHDTNERKIVSESAVGDVKLDRRSLIRTNICTCGLQNRVKITSKRNYGLCVSLSVSLVPKSCIYIFG